MIFPAIHQPATSSAPTYRDLASLDREFPYLEFDGLIFFYVYKSVLLCLNDLSSTAVRLNLPFQERGHPILTPKPGTNIGKTIMTTPSQEQDTPKLYSPHGLTRWYIDTRDLTLRTSALPLLDTLQPSEQISVQHFYHLADRRMSLASNLLKYLFIHQTCRVPWDQIVISRTPAPHKRPCYIPVRRGDDDTEETTNIEFNVSHQASMVTLAGCILPSDAVIPGFSGPDVPNPGSHPNPNPDPSPTGQTSCTHQIGIDITCTDERERRNADSVPKREAELHDFIDVFQEVFSAREIADMKRPIHVSQTGVGVGQDNALTRSIRARLRRFYTYWALKEAYIKMTGEALLAPWLRDLEFLDVIAPEPPKGGENGFGEPYKGTRILMHGKEVTDVRMEVVALGNGYLIATAARGKGVGKRKDGDEVDLWEPFREIDIERDIAPCARGQCQCLAT